MKVSLVIIGAAVLLFAWAGLGPFAERAFFVHMTMHMAVVAVAAPLIALGIADSHWDPVRRWPGFFAPVPLSIAELIAVWAWHTPGLHHLARHTLGGFVAEQAIFLIAGLLVWLSAFGGARGNFNRTGAGIIGLLLTSMHMTLLGALLALTPRALYEHHQGFHSLTALGDQQLGGAIMILIGGASYLAGGLCLSRGLLRERVTKTEFIA
ncbi:MAG TPA: cytochrome c oxidase assembly protein [Verrucomicrobiae bacterium]|nr:cytochrome c oxidase assembly protein [Verrucomicrobiae bacterium]